MRSLIPFRVQQQLALRIVGWLEEWAPLLEPGCQSYTVNQSAPCLESPMRNMLPGWGSGLMFQAGSGDSPERSFSGVQINHRLNMNTLSVILFLHFTLYSGTVFMFLVL